MSIRLVAGRAGSGKSRWCQEQVCAALRSALIEGQRLILLVPEQAALQMERAILSRLDARVLGRCDVLSFRRLAFRILGRTDPGGPVPMTPLGRGMAIRHLLGRRRAELREFRRVPNRAGFVSALSNAIVELIQEGATLEQLESAAAGAEAARHASAPRLHDVGLLYRAYLEFLGSDRVDPEGVLELAAARLGSMEWLDGAQVWVDGFAGFTRQQARMLVALAQRVAHIDLALLMDPARFAGPGRSPGASQGRAARGSGTSILPVDDAFSLFARTERTWRELSEALRDGGVAIDAPLMLGSEECPRFRTAPRLAYLERSLFSVDGCGATANSSDLGVAPAPPDAPADADAASEVRLIIAADRRSEVRACVAAVRDLVARPVAPLRYRDIAVIVRDLEPYHDLLSAALREAGVPFFIDRRLPTHHHPLIELVRSLLAMQGPRAFGTAMALLMKTGLCGLDDEAADAVENYQLACGLVTAESWEEAWTIPPPGVPHDRSRQGDISTASRRRLERLNDARQALRAALGDWWPRADGRAARPACETWIRRLYGVLERLEIRRQLSDWCAEAGSRGALPEVEEHEQAWTDLMSMLDELAATLGEERMTGRQFQEVVESGLSELTLGLVPATVDQVLVGSIERSRHPPIRAAFILGFTSGQFPASIREDSILADDERLLLEGSGISVMPSRARLLDERMLAYIALTRASDFLWISRPEADDQGRELAPSPFWSEVRAALPGIQVERIESDDLATACTGWDLAALLAMRLRSWCEARPGATVDGRIAGLYERARARAPLRSQLKAALSGSAVPLPARLPPERVGRLWPPPYAASVTRLEQFAQCPFKHFASYGLVLRERPRQELAAVDLGRLYHSILEQFVNDLLESDRKLADLHTADIAERIARFSALAVQADAERLRLEDGPRRRALRRSMSDLQYAVTGQRRAAQRSELAPWLTEAEFNAAESSPLPALVLTTPAGRTVTLHGRIDRVDLLPVPGGTAAVVFDYKRSVKRRLLLEEVYYGLSIQLLAYLLVLKESGVPSTGTKLLPGGAFYLPLVGGLQSVDHPSELEASDYDAHRGFRPRGIIDFDFIDQLDPVDRQSPGATGRRALYSAYVLKDGGPGHLETTDAAPGGVLPQLLEHVRRKMGELADGWIDGDIRVAPMKIGDRLPCSHCSYRSVCRFEYAQRGVRIVESLSRTEVMRLVAGATEGQA